MSSVDTKVVNINLDSKGFETGSRVVLTLLNTIGQALSLEKQANVANRAIQSVSNSISKISFSGLNSAIDTVSNNFSAMETIATGAFLTIGNAAVNLGFKIASALSSGVRQGFGEYELQLNSVQTILANTQSKGTTIDQVNSALDELNNYADLTIYNFSEMTRNIGTFTAAGVDLETSVSSIKGIANLAAMSGSTSTQAATAMYQLSQALAAGRVQLMDWNSVVNAGMGGEVFQTALKRTATQMGYNVDALIEKYGSFRESLTQGEWLTTDVLTETLKQLSGAYTEADLIEQGYTESQASAIIQLATTAEDAATKVKTFSQLMGTIAEEIGSGWAQTWEYIFGDFEQAKTLWTNISTMVTGVIQSISSARNTLLKGGLGSKSISTKDWEEFAESVNLSTDELDAFQKKLIEVASNDGIDVDKLIRQNGSFSGSLSTGWLTVDIVSEALSGSSESVSDFTESTTQSFSSLEDVVNRVISGEFGNGEERVQALAAAGYDYAVVQDNVNSYLRDGTLSLEGYTDEQIACFTATNDTANAVGDLSEAADNAESPFSKLLESVDGQKTGYEELANGLQNIVAFFTTLANIAGEAFGIIFPEKSAEEIHAMAQGFREFTDGLTIVITDSEDIRYIFEGIFSVIGLVTDAIGGAIDGFSKLFGSLTEDTDGSDVLSFFGEIGLSLKDFRENADVFDKVSGAIQGFAGIIKTVWGYISAFWQEASPGLKLLAQTVFELFGSIWMGLNELVGGTVGTEVSAVTDGFSSFGKVVGTVATAISNFIATFKDGVGPAFSKIFDTVKEVVSGIEWSESDGIFGLFSNIKEAFGEISKALISEDSADEVFEFFKTVIGLGSDLITNTIPMFSHAASLVGTLIDSFVEGASNLISSPWDTINAILTGVGLAGFVEVTHTVRTVKNAIEDTGSLFGDIGDAIKNIRQAKSSIAQNLNGVSSIFKSIAVCFLAVAAIIYITKDLNETQINNIARVFVGIIAVMVVLIALGAWVSKAKNVNSSLGMLAAIFIGLLAAAVAIKILAGLSETEFQEGGIRALMIVGVIAAILIGLTVLSKFGKETDAKTMIGIAAFMVVLSLAMIPAAIAIAALSFLDSDKVAKSAAVLFGLFAGFAAILAALVILDDKFASIDFATVMLIAGYMAVMSLSMLPAAAALMMVSAVDSAKLAVSAAIMAGLFAVFALILVGLTEIQGKSSKKIKSFLGIAASFVLFGIAISAMADGLVKLADIPQDRLAIASGVVILMFGIFAALMAGLSKVIGKDAKSILASGAIIFEWVVFCGSLVILSEALEEIGKLDDDILKKSELAITGIAAIFGVLVGVLSKIIGKDAKTIVASFVVVEDFNKFAVALAKLSEPLKNIGELDDDTLQKSELAIAGIAAIFGVIVGVFSKLLSGKDSLDTLISSILVIEEWVTFCESLSYIADALTKLGEIDADKLDSSSNAILKIAGAFVLITGSGGLLSLLGWGAIGGELVSMSFWFGFIESLNNLVTPLSELSKINNITDVASAIEKLTSAFTVMTGAGGLIAALTGGLGVLGELATMAMWQQFIESLNKLVQPLTNLSKIKNLDDVSTAITKITGAFTAMTSSGAGTGLVNLLTSFSPAGVDVMSQWNAFIDSLNDLAVPLETLSGIQNIDNAATAIEKIGDAFQAVNDSTAVSALVSGLLGTPVDTDLTAWKNFISSLNDLVSPLQGLSGISGIENAGAAIEHVGNAFSAIQTSTAIANLVLGLFGTPSDDLGMSNWTSFVSSLTDLATPLQTLAGISGIENAGAAIESVGNAFGAIQTATVLQEVASGIFQIDAPKEGETSNWVSFISSLNTLSEPLGSLASIQGVSDAGTAVESIGNAFSAINNSTGLTNIISGVLVAKLTSSESETQMSNFSGFLGSLPQLADPLSKIAGIEGDVSGAATAIGGISDAFAKINDSTALTTLAQGAATWLSGFTNDDTVEYATGAEQFATFCGSLSGISTSLQELANAGDLTNATTVIGDLAEIFGTITGTDSLADALTKILSDNPMDDWATFLKSLTGDADGKGGLIEAVQTLNNASGMDNVPSVTAALVEIFPKLEELGKVMKEANDGFLWIKGNISGAVDAMPDWTSFINALVGDDNNSGLISSLDKLNSAKNLSSISTKVGYLSGIMTGLDEIGKVLQNTDYSNLDTAGLFNESKTSKWKQFIEILTDPDGFFTKDLSTLNTFDSTAYGNVSDTVNRMQASLSQLVDLATFITDNSDTLTDAQSEATDIWFEFVKSIIQGISTKISDDSGENEVNTIGDVILSSVGDVDSEQTTQAMQALFDGINTAANDFSASFSMIGVAIGSGIAYGIKDGDFTSVGSDLLTTISTAIAEKNSDFINIGKAIASTVVSGMSGSISEAGEATQPMGESAGNGYVNGLTDALGIASPSKKMQWISEMCVAGLNRGWSNGMPSIGRTLDKVSDYISVNQDWMNISPSVTPVIDLSSMSNRSIMTQFGMTASMNAQYLGSQVTSVSSMIYASQQAIMESNNRVIDSINSLNSGISTIADKDFAPEMYVDGQLLATTIAKPMDRALNIRYKRGRIG